MIDINASQLIDLRRRRQIQGPCSLQLGDHTWAMFVRDDDYVCAIICVLCGLFPIEVMSLWPIER